MSLLDEPETFPISLETLDSDDVHSLADWPRAADVEAIDFFCGRNPEDPTGEQVASALIAFVRALAFHRVELAADRCRLTVVTRGAAFEVDDPRGAALWGALRGMAIEAGEEAGLDFRLVDLGAASDLETLRWLDRYDLRERELTIRGGRLWVPRVQSIRERFPEVPAGEDAAYRLCLDNPGAVERTADEDLRARSPGTGHGRDRRESGGAQLPRRHGDPGTAAPIGLRAFRARARGGNGSERRRPQARRGHRLLSSRRRGHLHLGRMHRQPDDAREALPLRQSPPASAWRRPRRRCRSTSPRTTPWFTSPDSARVSASSSIPRWAGWGRPPSRSRDMSGRISTLPPEATPSALRSSRWERRRPSTRTAKTGTKS